MAIPKTVNVSAIQIPKVARNGKTYAGHVTGGTSMLPTPAPTPALPDGWSVIETGDDSDDEGNEIVQTYYNVVVENEDATFQLDNKLLSSYNGLTNALINNALMLSHAPREGENKRPIAFGVESSEGGVTSWVTVSPQKFSWGATDTCDFDVATATWRAIKTSGDVTVGGNSDVAGDSLVEGNLTVYKATTLVNGLTVDKQTTLSDGLSVGGDAYVRGNLQVIGDITGPVASATKRGVISVAIAGSGNAVVNAQLANGGLTLTKGTISSGITSLNVTGSGNVIKDASATSSTITLTKGYAFDSISTSGSGNAVVNVSASGSTLTINKGTISSGILGISVTGTGNVITGVSATSSIIVFTKGQVGVGDTGALEAKVAALEAKVAALEAKIDKLINTRI